MDEDKRAAVDEAVANLVDALNDANLPPYKSVAIDVQDNGEYPYRIACPDEIYPVIGLATKQHSSNANRSEIPPKRKR